MFYSSRTFINNIYKITNLKINKESNLLLNLPRSNDDQYKNHYFWITIKTYQKNNKNQKKTIKLLKNLFDQISRKKNISIKGGGIKSHE